MNKGPNYLHKKVVRIMQNDERKIKIILWNFENVSLLTFASRKHIFSRLGKT